MIRKNDPRFIKLLTKLDFLISVNSKFNPNKKLILAVIRQGLADRDYEYFDSRVFNWHMSLLGANIKIWKELMECTS